MACCISTIKIRKGTNTVQSQQKKQIACIFTMYVRVAVTVNQLEYVIQRIGPPFLRNNIMHVASVKLFVCHKIVLTKTIKKRLNNYSYNVCTSYAQATNFFLGTGAIGTGASLCKS